MRYCLIEDEYYTRVMLHNMIQELQPEAQLVGEAEDLEGVAECLEAAPDLLLSDIRLADGMAHDRLLQLGCRLPVIFVTAYIEHRPETASLNVVDYLLKPVAPESMAAALRKIHRQEIPAI